jgi:hypothetical protein
MGYGAGLCMWAHVITRLFLRGLRGGQSEVGVKMEEARRKGT